MKLDNLQKIRKAKGMTREELSIKSGVPIVTIKALENGLNNAENMKLSTLLKLSKALNVKAKKLLDIEIAKKL